MSIWGTLIGGMLGFTIGGPIGALLGSLIASNSSFVTTPSALLIFADKIIKANAKICWEFSLLKFILLTFPPENLLPRKDPNNAPKTSKVAVEKETKFYPVRDEHQNFYKKK